MIGVGVKKQEVPGRNDPMSVVVCGGGLEQEFQRMWLEVEGERKDVGLVASPQLVERKVVLMVVDAHKV